MAVTDPVSRANAPLDELTMDDGDNLPLKHFPPESGYDSPLHSPLPPYVDPDDTPTVRQKAGMPWNSLSPAYSGMSLPLPSKPSNGNKRIDFVLVYKNKDLEEVHDPQQKSKLKIHAQQRALFLKELQRQGIAFQEDVYADKTFVKLHTSFSRLCEEAENVKLELPLTGCEIYDDAWNNCFTRFVERNFVTDDEVDFVSAPFDSSKLEVFDGYKNEDTFFRPSLRSLLTRHILINMDVQEKSAAIVEVDTDGLTRRGLPYFLMKGIFEESLILHDEAANDLAEQDEIEEAMAVKGQKMSDQQKTQRSETQISTPDTRHALNDTWCKPFKFQPLWKVRNYFGEKIGLYFAWSGSLITSLWIPALFGLAVFIYGLVLSLERRRSEKTLAAVVNASLLDEAKKVLTSSLDSVKEAFDNDVTPYFALVICLWGTIFLEYWKRKNATLAYEWDVDGFESSEPDRPEFFGTKTRPDPVTMLETWYYPMKRQMIKFSTSAGVLFIMVSVVFISVAAVILYRVIMSIDFCSSASEVTCLLVTTICSSILNAISIMILGKLYEKLAVVLTDWENHRTQTQYDDGLILKLFAFQFANSYSSLFYIAFFRGVLWPDGIFGLGPEYQDTCGSYNYTISANGTRAVAGRGSSDEGANCMSMLSFQLLTVMIIKPLPKFFKDIVLPWLKSKWKKRQCCRKKKVHDREESGRSRISTFTEREYNKPALNDFTLTEYTEKVIMYGYVMLFSASFSLGPLIVLIILLIDIRVDAKRMLWMYRRPNAYISQDIGMWFNILSFLNVCGVVSNAFIVAFTSRWGQQYSMVNRLWIVIGFENICFAIKFIIAYTISDVPAKVFLATRQHVVLGSRLLFQAIIPDVPKTVRLCMRRHVVFLLKFLLASLIRDVPNKILELRTWEKYQVAKIMNQGGRAIQPRKAKLGQLNEGDEIDMLSSPPPASEGNYESEIRKRKKKRNFLEEDTSVDSVEEAVSPQAKLKQPNNQGFHASTLPPIKPVPSQNQEGDQGDATSHWSVARTAVALKPNRFPDPACMTQSMGEITYGDDGNISFGDSTNVKKRSSNSGSNNNRRSSKTTEYRISWPDQMKKAEEPNQPYV